MKEIFDIFDKFFGQLQTTDSVKDNLNENTKINGVDLKDVSKEDFEKTMNYLEDLKKIPLMGFLISPDNIDEICAELQAKWDIVHEEPEETKEEVNPIDANIEKLVDEYLDNELKDTKDFPIVDRLRPYAKESYMNFAKFIYNHK